MSAYTATADQTAQNSPVDLDRDIVLSLNSLTGNGSELDLDI